MGALLQQGSVLIGDAHLRLVRYLALDEEARERARRALADNAGACGRHLGAERRLERWAASLTQVTPGARPFSGEQGAFLLTPLETAPYTPASRLPSALPKLRHRDSITCFSPTRVPKPSTRS